MKMPLKGCAQNREPQQPLQPQQQEQPSSENAEAGSRKKAASISRKATVLPCLKKSIKLQAAGKGLKGAKTAKKTKPKKSNGDISSKPMQMHHYATNKSSTYTPQLKEIVNKYGLELDEVWNKELLPHQGRHLNAYHEYILESVKQFDEIAQGDSKIFLQLFDNLKRNVKANPNMLYKDYWK